MYFFSSSGQLRNALCPGLNVPPLLPSPQPVSLLPILKRNWTPIVSQLTWATLFFLVMSWRQIQSNYSADKQLHPFRQCQSCLLNVPGVNRKKYKEKDDWVSGWKEGANWFTKRWRRSNKETEQSSSFADTKYRLSEFLNRTDGSFKCFSSRIMNCEFETFSAVFTDIFICKYTLWTKEKKLINFYWKS